MTSATLVWAAFAATLGSFGTATVARAQETLMLAVDDAEGEPGRLGVLILRSYQPRPVSQGQVCFAIGEPRFTAIRRSKVTSVQDDATFTASLMSPTEAMVTMESPSASINQAEGPIILIAFRVDPAATPGSMFPIAVHLPDSFLVDESGAPISIETMPGTFTVKAPGAPLKLEADKAKGPSGFPVTLDVATREFKPLSSGQIDYRYDPAVFPSIDLVQVVALGNDVTFTADTSVPGRILVNFTAPGTVGKIPGPIVTIVAHVASGLPDRFTSPLTIEPATTTLTARDGTVVPLLIDDGEFEVRN